MMVIHKNIYRFIVKSGYKPKIKYKSLIILPYFCLHNEKRLYKSDAFNIFLPSSPLANESLKKSLLFRICNISFWLYFSSILFYFFKKKAGTKVEKETPWETASKEVQNNGDCKATLI